MIMELFNLNKKKADFIKIKVEKLVDWNEPNGDGCVVSDKITKEGFKVGYKLLAELCDIYMRGFVV